MTAPNMQTSPVTPIDGGTSARLAEGEANTAEKLRLKKRIEIMTRLELQIRVIFLEGLFEGATGKVAPVSPA
ncbi:hypothetical protein NKH72_17065 [Mesorhizobium sp. M0955]|uniref:hypothetical protein n=1 Tax=Mesorhizobium sp. M0955 TaxID=2957033 RepID=UPI003334FB0E